MCKFFKKNVLFKYYMLAAFHIIPYYFSKIKLFLGKLKKKEINKGFEEDMFQMLIEVTCEGVGDGWKGREEVGTFPSCTAV